MQVEVVCRRRTGEIGVGVWVSGITTITFQTHSKLGREVLMNGEKIKSCYYVKDERVGQRLSKKPLCADRAQGLPPEKHT